MNHHKCNNINYLWSSLLIDELVRNGVTYFCISPGSRSSPLTVSVANHPKAQSFIHFDERASAFHALGYASATGQPACIITTSGTAAANLFPAVIEASKKKIPLIILTADRPPELRHSGAHQTIDQVKLFGSYVRHFTDMPAPTADIQPNFVLTTVDQAVFHTKGELKGPVHLNCMFREPLTPVKDKNNLKTYLKPLTGWLKTTAPYTTYKKEAGTLSAYDLKEIAEKIGKLKNGLILAGKLSTEEGRKNIIKIAQRLNWPVFADFTSGLRQSDTSRHVIHYFDQLLLNPKIRKSLKFDGILHFGGRMTSKRLYEFIEQQTLKEYIMVLNHPLRNDPLHNVSLRIQANTNTFTEKLCAGLKSRSFSGQLKKIIQSNATAERIIEKNIFETPDITESAVARLITRHIPKEHALFLSNSLPLRETDMFSDVNDKTYPVGANRGASGIDGIIASACGFSQGLNKPVTLLIGDLAFLYDVNALSMLEKINKPMTIIVLNNDGGGIFSFLPIASQTSAFEKFFGTPHGLQFKGIAETFGLSYANPTTNNDFLSAYERGTSSKVSTLIEVRTRRSENLKHIQHLQNQIKNLK